MHFTGTNLKTLNLNNNTHKNHASNVHETEQKIHSPNRARLKYFLFHFLSQQRDKKTLALSRYGFRRRFIYYQVKRMHFYEAWERLQSGSASS